MRELTMVFTTCPYPDDQPAADRLAAELNLRRGARCGTEGSPDWFVLTDSRGPALMRAYVAAMEAEGRGAALWLTLPQGIARRPKGWLFRGLQEQLGMPGAHDRSDEYERERQVAAELRRRRLELLVIDGVAGFVTPDRGRPLNNEFDALMSMLKSDGYGRQLDGPDRTTLVSVPVVVLGSEEETIALLRGTDTVARRFARLRLS